MTAEQKAKILLAKFSVSLPQRMEGQLVYAKACAIIAVDEIIEVLGDSNEERERRKEKWNYWQSVKQQIQQL